jgi:hypothetical protein
MSSLQQLFTAQFDANAIKQVKLMDSKALLYRRSQSVQWQVRFKLAKKMAQHNNKYRRYRASKDKCNCHY